MVYRKGQTESQKLRYGSSNIVVFSMTFMKCCHGSVDMRQKHGKMVTGRRCVILGYRRCSLMYEVRGEDDRQNTL